MSGIIEHVEAFDNDYVAIKFEPSLKRASITNDKFELYKLEDGATPTPVPDPFQPIDVANHYHSVSKLLYLYWNQDVVEEGVTYQLQAVGLQNALGMTLKSGAVQFTATTGFVQEPGPFIPPDDIGFVEKDFSVRTDIYSGDDITPAVIVTGGFNVDSVDPADGSTYLYPDENNGVIKINFSGTLDAAQLTDSTFKVQRKAISRNIARWETLEAEYALDEEDSSVVYVRLPSTDTTPVYDTAGAIYFEPGHKYRIIVSKVLEGAVGDEASPIQGTLSDDYVINYVSELSPAYLDPESILDIFPDADPAEVMESIHYVSLEVETWFKGKEIPHLAYEYMKAAVACDLSRRLGLDGGDEYSITLGDLSVTNRQGSTRNIDRATATGWCEIAAVLRKELSVKLASSMKGVVRGSRHANPMPRRSIYKTNPNEVHMQGTLDDVNRPPQRF